MSNSPLPLQTKFKTQAPSAPLDSALGSVNQCYDVLNLCKSEVIDFIESRQPPIMQRMNTSDNDKNSSGSQSSPQDKGSLKKVMPQFLLNRHDFKTLGILGQGSYGTVYLSEKDGLQYALKEVSKSFILKVLSQ